MTGIGGPGGIGGPKGPGATSGIDDPGGIDEIGGDADLEGASGTQRGADLDALSADLTAGKLTPQEAIDRLVEATVTPEMDASERAELRELLTDLVANDPYLGGLTGRLQ